MKFEVKPDHIPTKILFGNDSLCHLERFIKDRNILLVTSEGFVKRGLVDKLYSNIKNIKQVIDNVKSHPEKINTRRQYETISHKEIDLVIAIGGGSVIDTAKFLSIYNEDLDYKFVENLTVGAIPKRGYLRIPFISIPTTSGTASEITPYATIWDNKLNKKYSLNLPDLYSEVAIYDPTLTLSLSKKLTTQTALDTLSHSMDSIWNKNANEVTLRFSINAAKLVVENLVLLTKDLQDIILREKIMRACMYAGFAFSKTKTSLAHGISYMVTNRKGIDHGIACSFTLPAIIDASIGKFRFLDDAIIEIFGELSSKKLRDIYSELGVSTEPKDYQIDDKEWKEILDISKGNERSANSLISLI